MATSWEKLYGSSSITVKALAFIPYLATYWKTYRFLKRSQYWDAYQIERYQTDQLKKLIAHAYENVPYYKRIFDERNLVPSDIQTIADLQKLPFLTKELVRENFADLKARNFPDSKFEYVTTGGTTGVPMGFYYEKGVSRAIEWAFMKMQWERVGYSFFDKCVYLKGFVIQSDDGKKYGKRSFFNRWLILSSFDMTEDNLKNHIRSIGAFRPVYIQAYPSSITILAQYMKKHNIRAFDSVKAILCGSENMYPGQRELIENVFQCRVYTWYGQAERIILAGECETASQYHVFPEYGIIELVDREGRGITQPSVEGTIVGTGLTNYVMPLIRYKTDDMCEYSHTSHCLCNRNHILIENVKGRWTQEFIIAPHNRKVSITALNMHSNLLDNVKQFQFYQERIGEVILNIVPGTQYTEKDTENIQTELQKKLGGDVELTITKVESIERTQMGKFRFLIQQIPTEKIEEMSND
jgi:phenylacetate-CoA ligase